MDFKIVIDASVAVKWYIRDEINADRAIEILGDFEKGKIKMVVPPLFYYETGNAVNTAVIRKRITEEEGQEIIKDMLETDLEIFASDNLIPSAYMYARKYTISIYDASYIAVAREYTTTLYTADRKFYDAVKRKINFVRWIGEYKNLYRE